MNYLTIVYPKTASILFQGQQYRNLQQVYLSSSNITFPSLCAVQIGTTNPSALTEFPPFTGYQLPANYWYIRNDNVVVISLTSFNTTGAADIILYNVAGYSKLSDKGYLIQYN